MEINNKQNNNYTHSHTHTNVYKNIHDVKKSVAFSQPSYDLKIIRNWFVLPSILYTKNWLIFFCVGKLKLLNFNTQKIFSRTFHRKESKEFSFKEYQSICVSAVGFKTKHLTPIREKSFSIYLVPAWNAPDLPTKNKTTITTTKFLTWHVYVRLYVKNNMPSKLPLLYAHKWFIFVSVLTCLHMYWCVYSHVCKYPQHKVCVK